MARRFLDQLGGIITVNLRGSKLEKVMNLALSRGIFIWDIKKSDETVNFKVRSSGYEALKEIADENGFILVVTGKEGLPFFKKIAQRRLGFIVGGLIFVTALYLMSSFIWLIELSGNKNVKSNSIISTAARHGVYKGAAKWSFSRSEVEEAILRDISELTYVKLDIQGVKLNIQVVEKVFPGEEINGPCHMVASKDGVVEEILVLDGQASVKEGDVIAKGDILISGIVFPQKSPYVEQKEDAEEEAPYLLRARGKVKARVWYEGYGECKILTEKTVLSGREINKVLLETPWKEFILKGRRESGFPLSQQKVTGKKIKTPLGNFGIRRLVIEEQIKESIRYSESEAIEIAREKALEHLEARSGKAVDKKALKTEILSLPSDPVLRIKASMETIEDIAVARAIKTGENGN